MQSIITYVILSLVVLLVIRHLARIIRKPKDQKPPTCSGCPLSETCGKTCEDSLHKTSEDSQNQ